MTPDEAIKAVGRKTLVQARSSTGELVGEGRVIAYSMVPTVTIERTDGSRFSWRHDMVHADVVDQIISEWSENAVDTTHYMTARPGWHDAADGPHPGCKECNP